MYTNFHNSANIPLPSVKVHLAVPSRSAGSQPAVDTKLGGTHQYSYGRQSNPTATASVASSIESLARCCNLSLADKSALKPISQQQASKQIGGTNNNNIMEMAKAAKLKQQQQQQQRAQSAGISPQRRNYLSPQNFEHDGNIGNIHNEDIGDEHSSAVQGLNTTASGMFSPSIASTRATTAAQQHQNLAPLASTTSSSDKHAHFTSSSSVGQFSPSAIAQRYHENSSSQQNVFSSSASSAASSLLPPQLNPATVIMPNTLHQTHAEVAPHYNSGFSAFEFALESALTRLDSSKKSNQQKQQQKEVSIDEKWRAVADCLTSAQLDNNLHRLCRDVEMTIEELIRANSCPASSSILGHQQQQQQQQQNTFSSSSSGYFGGSGVLSPTTTSPTSRSKTKQQKDSAKTRLNGTQTAMAAMLLEQCLAGLGDAAPYSRPALKWILDTIFASIYVSYDIVKADLAKSFEFLNLNCGGSSGSDFFSLSSSDTNEALLTTPNPATSSSPLESNSEKLISRFYGKTFFQTMRSLSSAARAHAEQAEEVERAKTRQSRVLERAITYWARYSMRRVLGAWRGFAKNEKIERELREQVDELKKDNKELIADKEAHEKDHLSSENMVGTSQEALQLQVRELQRALDFERRRATRAEAALAVRIVEEAQGGGSGRGDASSSSGGDFGSDHGGGDSIRSSSAHEVTSLRAEVAHYRAVAVEACRLGDIDLRELERAVTAQTTVLARGMAC